MKSQKSLMPVQGRFFAGILALPAFLFLPSVILKGGLFLFYLLLFVLDGRKVRVLPVLSLFLGLLLLNLLVPRGKVLFYLGIWPVSQGALVSGCGKFITLAGLIYFSRFVLKDRLPLPGKVGRWVSLVFFYYERLLDRADLSLFKKSPGKWMDGVDDLLLSVYGEAEALPSSIDYAYLGDGVKARIFLISFVFIHWGLFGASLFLS